jgi:hypothetical protein
MNVKVLLGFLAGAALALVGSYWLTHRQTAEQPVTSTLPAPPAITTREPAPDVLPPVPPEAESPRPAPAPVKKPPIKPAVKSSPRSPVHRLPSYVYRPQVTPPATVPKEPPAVASAPTPKLPAIEAPPPELPAPLPAIEAKLPPPEPHTVTIRNGTLFRVRLGEALSAQHNRPGDAFAATLDQELVVEGFVIAERGSQVEGRVVQAEEAGRTRGLSHLSLELTRIHTSDDQMLPVHTTRFEQLGPPVDTRLSFKLDQPVTITERLQR